MDVSIFFGFYFPIKIYKPPFDLKNVKIAYKSDIWFVFLPDIQDQNTFS